MNRLKVFSPPADTPIAQDGLTMEQGGWRIEAKADRTVRLFEVANPGVDDCMLTYRVKMKSANLEGRAYLEMLCKVPGFGEAFSKGYVKDFGGQAATGTMDWASFEVPFFLEKGQRPEMLKLNLIVEGKGTVWVKDVELLRGPHPVHQGPPADPDRAQPANALPVAAGTVKAFAPAEKPLTTSGVSADQTGWRIDADKKRTVHLYTIKDVGHDACLLTYRAQMKSADLKGKAYLEMWCHLPGDPDEREYFSKGLMTPITGTTGWASYETPFRLEKGQGPDRIKLNVVLEDRGTVWIKDIELLHGPLPK